MSPVRQGISHIPNFILDFFVLIGQLLYYVLSFLIKIRSIEDSVVPTVVTASQKICGDEQKESSNASLNFTLSFVRLHKRLFLSLFDPEKTSVMALHELNNNFLILPFVPDPMAWSNMPETGHEVSSHCQVSLAEIYSFDSMIRAHERQNPGTKLVFSVSSCPLHRARAVLLLGCHMIMTREISLKRTLRLFAPVSDLLESPIPDSPRAFAVGAFVGGGGELTAAGCWGAVAAAKGHGWIDLGRVFVTGTEAGGALYVDEYLHYSE
jgi:hypothetical protein